MPRPPRHGANEPPTETLTAGVAGLIFLLVGFSHGGQYGDRLGFFGLAVIVVAALIFFLRLALWLRHREPPAPPEA